MPRTATKSANEAKATAIAKARAKAPELPARIGSTPATKLRAQDGIFGRLIEDHDKHRALLAMIGEAKAGSAQRAALFAEFWHETKGHAAAEDQALWSTILRNPDTTDFARHAVAEHHELDEMFADLAARDPATRAWGTRFEALKHKYLHHIREEEQEQFVAAEKTLSEADKRYMRGVFNRRKKAEKAAATIEPKLSVEPLA